MDLSAYAELPGHHLCFSYDAVASAPTTEYQDSAEDRVSDVRANAACVDDQEGASPFLAAYYYYFGVPDPDSGDDCYDPTRKSFHIETADEDDGRDGDDASTPPPVPRVEHPKEPAAASVPVGHRDVQLEQIRELQIKLDEERERLHWLRHSLELEQANQAASLGARQRA